MSFDDYAYHIYQKHRLAVALAIIKTKPPNITTENYINQLKSKLDKKMEDDDVTVCSDDFIIDDDDLNDSVTILKDFHVENFGRDNGFKDFGETNNDEALIIPEDTTQTTYYDSSQTQFTPDVNKTETGTEIFVENNNSNQNFGIEQTTNKNIVNTYKGFDEISNNDKTATNKTKSHDNYKENNAEIEDKSVNSENMDLTYYDSQKTILYTVHGYTQNYTHCSPSQSDIIIPRKYILGVDKNQNESVVQNKHRIEGNSTVDIEAKSVETNKNADFEKGNLKNTVGARFDGLEEKMHRKNNERHEFDNSQSYNIISQSKDVTYDQIQNDFGNINTYFNKYSDRAANYSHTVNNNELEPTKNRPNQNLTQNSTNKDEYFEEIQKLVDDEYSKEYTEMKIIENDLNTHNNSNKTEPTNSENDIPSVADFPKNNTEIEELDEAEEYDSHETISYKVLGEFNKVKRYLNRRFIRRMSCDGYSTDSGYRSDSQVRNSNRSALQLSGIWLNQSGCCLYNYIIQCPLVSSTRDITNEIAQVLSQLIDRLHEEQNYPSFLEDILETVDELLRHIYEGESSGESEFLKKDDHVQRILLLNKSIHIQRHTIEKISNILETFHSKITEIDSTYELSNIDQIENVTYIFHILEILLKKYLKNRDLLSQSSTQMSQDEDKVLKKSSITDIWRKKWNPSQLTSQVFEGSRDKKCVLKVCGDVLNKIVVDCVSSYSLIAYSALKCFNSMQS